MNLLYSQTVCPFFLVSIQKKKQANIYSTMGIDTMNRVYLGLFGSKGFLWVFVFLGEKAAA